MTGKLREALEGWVQDQFPPEGGPGWWDRVRSRWRGYNDLLDQLRSRPGGLAWNLQVTWWASGVAYALFGSEALINDLQDRVSGIQNQDASQYIADEISKVFSHPAAKEIAEVLGALVTEPVISIFEQYAGDPDPDPHEFARAFHGFMISLNVSGGLIDTALETATGGQVEGVGRLLESMYWSLGLGFLGWQTLAPLLSSGLQPNLERYYSRLYRPSRFTAADLRDLYALGRLTEGQMRDAAADIGWRDVDIDQWIELAYRLLSESDIWQAYHQGHIDRDEVIARLRALGYNPADIPLLFEVNPPKDTDEIRSISVSNARRAFREALISEGELRDILAGLNYSTQEIDLIVGIENLQREQDSKALSQAQIKSAWEENVITDPEARHWLEVRGHGPDEIEIIMETWRREAVPEFRKLNAGTVAAAYVEGILNRSQARDKLIEIGLVDDDANLYLDLTERRNPDAFGAPVRPSPRRLTPGQLADLVETGLITADQMRTRLVEIGYNEDDARLLSETTRIRLTAQARPLPQRSIERAYVAGVIERVQASSLLAALGYTDAQTVIILDTLENENLGIFQAPPADRVRQLTPGALEDLRIAGLIGSDQMLSYLLDIGFTQDDAALLVDRAEQLAAPFVRPLTPIQIERAYLGAILTRTQALERLEGLAYSGDDAENLVTTWEVENPGIFDPGLEASTRQPTISALAVAVQNGIISEDFYYQRAVEIGYAPQDAALYLALAFRLEAKPTKSLSISQVQQLYDAGLMPFNPARTRIVQQGYSEHDATLLLRLRRDLITNTDVWYTLLDGGLDPIQALVALVDEGYTDDDILAAFGTLDPRRLELIGFTLQDINDILAEVPGGEFTP